MKKKNIKSVNFWTALDLYPRKFGKLLEKLGIFPINLAPTFLSHSVPLNANRKWKKQESFFIKRTSRNKSRQAEKQMGGTWVKP